MVSRARIASPVGLLIIMVALSANIIGLSALPRVREINGKQDGNGAQSKQEIAAAAGAASTSTPAGSVVAVGESTTASSGGGVKSAPLSSGVKTVYSSNNAEKLKRGLTNFMNNLNPAPYFVPPPKIVKPAVAPPVAGAQAEPATIVNDGSSAEVVIKGPNRLVQARQLGGPLRWGRR